MLEMKRKNISGLSTVAGLQHACTTTQTGRDGEAFVPTRLGPCTRLQAEAVEKSGALRYYVASETLIVEVHPPENCADR